MFTPVVQEPAAPPQPTVIEARATWSRAATIIGLVVAGMIVVPVLLFGVGVVFLRAGAVEVSVVRVSGEEFDAPRNFDMEMAVEVFLESGPGVSVPSDLTPGEDRVPVDGTVQFVSSVSSPAGQTHLYSYEALLLDSATGETLDCLGVGTAFGGSVACGETGRVEPLVLWGTDERPIGTWYSLAVSGLPLESTTLITETATGRFVAANVVNGIAYQEWPAGEGTTGGLLPRGGREFGSSVRSIAIDADGIIVWSERGNN